MQIDYSGTLSAVVGVFIGAAISGGAYLLRLRGERKRIINKCLFILLEIRHDFRLSTKLDLDRWMDIYVEEVKKRYPDLEIDTSSMLTMIRPFFEGYASKLLLTVSPGIDGSLKKKFLDVVSQLSEVEPVLAFTLSGKESLKKTLGKFDEQFKNSLVPMVTESSEQDKAIKFFSNLSQMNREGALKELEEEILVLGKNSSRSVNKQVKTVLNRDAISNEVELRKEINNVIDQLEKAFTIA